MALSTGLREVPEMRIARSRMVACSTQGADTGREWEVESVVQSSQSDVALRMRERTSAGNRLEAGMSCSFMSRVVLETAEMLAGCRCCQKRKLQPK